MSTPRATVQNRITLYALKYSVYCRIVAMVCHEKNVTVDWVEINPFDGSAPESYARRHPFNRVPALQHGDFSLYETAAITR